ncbi:TadE/TadG family type IV pilus assembly protein [Anatilimnocola floriformis]|uniref:TadE/TadG family type IV pilus assembly protein n=1 Tax=Anatilimnocola floriformis TaxID=2948575 RepID=UPI0020C21148|nr:TadE/TadG family type IV pilus assembly protein [Anatilimnocola floriformis]
MKQFTKKRRTRQGAVLALELIMVLPILLMVLLATVEFGILLMSSQGVGAAAAHGSRNSALPSSSKASVEAAVNAALDGYIWQSAQETVIYVDSGGGFVKDISGTVLSSAPSGSIVSVTVNVESDQAAPDLLKYFGISLAGKEITTTYVTRKE